jgi:glyoxylase-like metal-dependent hydrolase (beta-lactamase superfamily II)
MTYHQTKTHTLEMHRARSRRGALTLHSLLTAILLLPANAWADDTHLVSTKVTEGLYMLSGGGGNIGLMIGDDGTFLIDNQMATASPDLIALIDQLGGALPRFLINTHFHFDHTGGNVALGDAGTTIFSHEMARTRLADGSEVPLFNLSTPPVAHGGLPIATFNDEIASLEQ